MGFYITVLLVMLFSLTKSQPSCEDLQSTMGVLGRQLMQQQLFVEERIRSEGDSGLKQVRLRTGGTRPYYAETFGAAEQVAGMHDHIGYINTVGMGEVIGVMNGVEFRTRHNDYKLKMPSQTSGEYGATEDIPFPDVPPEVTAKSTLNEQVREMREWFKAWRDQDYSVRDYRKYFKPILCYLEGAWTISENSLGEHFDIDQEMFGATSWSEMLDKIRLTSYSGSKDPKEQLEYLPTTIIQMVNNTYPQLAQWNYRTICHPLERDLPLNRFRLVDDLSTRMKTRTPYDSMVNSRAARFQMNPKDEEEWEDGIANYGLLDELMYEVPGKDNYGGVLRDEAEDVPLFSYNSVDSSELNAANYHRWLRVWAKDAMGVQTTHRGFADANLFMAMTTQPEVAAVKAGLGQGRNKRVVSQRWSYAIPLEIIYLTPLSNWNPHHIPYKGDKNSDLAMTVTANSRNGGKTAEEAFDGTNSNIYCITPIEFYCNNDPANTTLIDVGVLDQEGEMHVMVASGIRVLFPSIPEVGVIRQRYPIFPLHGEGRAVWKELEALKDITLFPKSSLHLFREKPVMWSTGDGTPIIRLRMSPSDVEHGEHTHFIDLTATDVSNLQSGSSMVFTTTKAHGHTHSVLLAYSPPSEEKRGFFKFLQCDDRDPGLRCWDQHRVRFEVSV